MQIIIPMSGFGERFKKAGYTVPKPLIEVDGKEIIRYVVEMFPGESDIIFICNNEHLAHAEYRMREILLQACPTAQIIGIEPHKLGPVYAVKQAFDHIKPDEACIVNYCDFTCDWSYSHFKSWIAQTDPDGCVPAYKGFHPHSLGSTYYAYIREENHRIQDIQEKKPYTNTPMNEFASSGTYYFKSGKLLQHYIERTIDEGLMVNNEYYMSMVYKPMLEDNKEVSVYALEHFMQWGTPADLEEYLYWSKIFKYYQPNQLTQAHTGTLLMPMVGLGSRFHKAGYELPKPLIPVSGKPMYQQALADLPKMKKACFVIREDMPDSHILKACVAQESAAAIVIETDQITEGQAVSCLLAKEQINKHEPLVISACDNGVIFNAEQYSAEVAQDADILVWAIRGYPNAKKYPEMYGWVDADKNNFIQKVSVKVPLENPSADPIIIGTFTFKRASDFIALAEELIEKNMRVNNEFYVDSCINLALSKGLTCKVFEVDAYVCWGTPNDLKTFEYWQTCFHHWHSHSYKLDADKHVSKQYLHDKNGVVHAL